MNALVLPIVLAVQFLVTIAMFEALRWTGLVRRAAFAMAMLVVMCAPLAIHSDRRPLRLVAALFAAWTSSKLLDVGVSVRPTDRVTFAQYVLYLINPTWMVYGKPPRVPPKSVDARRLAVRLIVGSLAAVACAAVFRADWAQYPFALEHATKAVVLMSLIIAVTNAWSALWRVAGGTGMDAMGRPLTAPTVAEFWRRWNRPAQAFFRTFCFDRMGGARHAIRAMLATFAISALGHEYIFSIAAGRVQGYQTAFFLINGFAAVATLRVRPKGWRRITWTIATLVFVIATAVLFGISLNEIVSVYATRD